MAGTTGRRVLAGALCAAWLPVVAGLTSPGSAMATPLIAAHRGGAYVDGKPRFPENTMPAFRHAGKHGFILELDVKLTSDRVPVVFHDATLDRVTPCSGRIDRRTLEQLRDCPVDVLGSPGSSLEPPGSFTRNPKRTPIPTLAEVLEFARRHRLFVSPEIKNPPTDADFDPTTSFATRVMDAIAASRFPPSRLIVQSFWPLNLTVSELRMPGAETALLSLRATNDAAGPVAAASGFEWVSPEFGSGFANPQLAPLAHLLGRRVIAYTPNSEAELRTAARQHVDAVYTDDPLLARRVFEEVGTTRPPIPDPPSDEDCRDVRANRTLEPIEALDPEPRAPRVFAMQYKQEPRHVRSYAAFRTKIECMIREWVVPRLAKKRPSVVAFNEDVGLATIATGPRGNLARELFTNPGRQLSCEPQGVPCATLAAYETVGAAYAAQLAAYRIRFPTMPLISQNFVAATDTFARGWMQVFSDMARRYDVYILGSSNQAPFRESTDPLEIALLAEPGTRPRSVYVATSGRVYNEVFMWGPQDVRSEGPAPLRNVVASNRKVPVTPIEETLQISPGPATGPDAVENLRPFHLPGTEARIGFATSLPAFVFGDRDRGHECDDVSRTYMRCLDRLGVNLVMQDEANPGRWAAQGGAGEWQPLEWMTSVSRQVTDPTVDFDYNVTPAMVGNLADLAFDLQSSITQRGSKRGGCHFVGNSQAEPDDADELRDYAGEKRPEFLALAPWVVPDGPRSELREISRRLAPGSGDRLENDYLETALIADLPFPPDRSRRCVTAEAEEAKLDDDGAAGSRTQRSRSKRDRRARRRCDRDGEERRARCKSKSGAALDGDVPEREPALELLLDG